MQPGTAQGNRSDARRELDDSLAIRLPADIVEALGLKEGDEVGCGSPACGPSRSRATPPSGAKPLSRVSRSRAGSFRRIGNWTATTPTRARAAAVSIERPPSSRPGLTRPSTDRRGCPARGRHDGLVFQHEAIERSTRSRTRHAVPGCPGRLSRRELKARALSANRLALHPE